MKKFWKSLFINVQFEGRNLTCGTIYRPHHSDTGGLTCFFEDIDLIFKELNKTKKKCFLMGDFNINLLDSSDNNTQLFTDAMFNSNFYPLINKPTRITSSSASTIDHIWTNVTNTCINSGIITHCVTDHLIIY